jgi:hypothetical protein
MKTSGSSVAPERYWTPSFESHDVEQIARQVKNSDDKEDVVNVHARSETLPF